MEQAKQRKPLLSAVKPAQTAFEKKVLKVINKTAEQKYLDTTNAAGIYTTFDINGVIRNLTQVVQGDTDSNRNGDEIRCRRLDLNVSSYIGDEFQNCRLILFRWNQDGSVAGPVFTDILPATVGIESPLALPYYDNIRSKKVEILFDEHYVHDVAHEIRIISKSFGLADKHISFTAGSTNGVGELYFLILNDHIAAGTRPNFNFFSRLYFVDV
jgi:hypothetical protein